jgi:transposase
MGDTRKSFTAEYKANAVALVVEDGRTIADVARGIGICAQTLGNWVAKDKAGQPRSEDLKESEREELERLRKEVADLRMKLEFSKKVAAWFAKGQQ